MRIISDQNARAPSFNSFKLKETSPVSSPSPAFRKPPKDFQNEMNKSSNKAIAKRRIILSDDEEDDEVPQNTKTSKSHNNEFQGWIEARDPNAISSMQRSKNIELAKLERKHNKASHSQVKSSLLRNVLHLKDEVEDHDDTDNRDLGSNLTKLALLRDEKYKNEREARLQRRQEQITNNRRKVQRIQDDDDEEGDNVKDDDDEDSSSDSDNDDENSYNSDDSSIFDNPSSTTTTGNSTNTNNGYSSHNERREKWSETALGKAEIKQEAKKIIYKCEKISADLRQSLRMWASGTPTTTTTATPRDCINITAINQDILHKKDTNNTSGNTGYNSTGSSTSSSLSKILNEEDMAKLVSNVQLKPYQLVGINWMKLLHENKINGVLADDMGLGKTVQCLSFLAWLQASNTSSSSSSSSSHQRRTTTHCIIVPASTLSNWENEIIRFCPQFKIMIYHGSQNERYSMRSKIRRYMERGHLDILLGTYTVFERESGKDDRKFLNNLSFEYLVLDEGHCIKNANSSRYMNLCNLKARKRLLLSGTPVQNDVSELLALLSFLMPKTFTHQDCEILIEAFNSMQSVSITQLRGILAPFVLRRLKRDVLEQLVEKTTTIIKINMTSTQKMIYQNIILGYAKRKENIKKQHLIEVEQEALIDVTKTIRKRKKMEVVESMIDDSKMIVDLITPIKSDPYTTVDGGTDSGSSRVIDISSGNTSVSSSSSSSSSSSADNCDDSNMGITTEDECTITTATVTTSIISHTSSSSSSSDTVPTSQLTDNDTKKLELIKENNMKTVNVEEETCDDELTAAAVINELSATEAKHLFTTLRKAANHPLLLRIRYNNEIELDKIAQVALANGYFGNQCDLARVKTEMETYSDFDIHQLCMMYPSYLAKYELPAESLYDSPKMMKLKEMLPTLIDDGHRILIFSQWTRILDLLEVLMNDMNIDYLRLDGSTPVKDRQALIDQFNNKLVPIEDDDEEEDEDEDEDVEVQIVGETISNSKKLEKEQKEIQPTPIPVFLLSTKAGGLGINLTSADTVILHDLDFNPENDRQAEDRCHRIGQTKPVHVYKLVTSDSVDEDIYDIGERKRQLSTAVLSDDRHHHTTGTTSSNKRKGVHNHGPPHEVGQGDLEDDIGDDVGAIGRILQRALQRANVINMK